MRKNGRVSDKKVKMKKKEFTAFQFLLVPPPVMPFIPPSVLREKAE